MGSRPGGGVCYVPSGHHLNTRVSGVDSSVKIRRTAPKSDLFPADSTYMCRQLGEGVVLPNAACFTHVRIRRAPGAILMSMRKDDSVTIRVKAI